VRFSFTFAPIIIGANLHKLLRQSVPDYQTSEGKIALTKKISFYEV
jgi:hypothetical protein